MRLPFSVAAGNIDGWHNSTVSEVRVDKRKERQLVIHDHVNQTNLKAVFTFKCHVNQSDLATAELVSLVIDNGHLQTIYLLGEIGAACELHTIEIVAHDARET